MQLLGSLETDSEDHASRIEQAYLLLASASGLDQKDSQEESKVY